MMTVWIAPHERGEALEAYSGWLTEEQVAQVNDAPEDVWISLERFSGSTTVSVGAPCPGRIVLT